MDRDLHPGRDHDRVGADLAWIHLDLRLPEECKLALGRKVTSTSCALISTSPSLVTSVNGIVSCRVIAGPRRAEEEGPLTHR
jgi:hypothetical protein